MIKNKVLSNVGLYCLYSELKWEHLFVFHFYTLFESSCWRWNTYKQNPKRKNNYSVQASKTLNMSFILTSEADLWRFEKFWLKLLCFLRYIHHSDNLSYIWNLLCLLCLCLSFITPVLLVFDNHLVTFIYLFGECFVYFY